ncbi:peroxiredoxin [Brevibacillus sp. H7]|uniref:peroxiredoxin n=1 Tax=Brevibacillus sp. H7 TaxID=3349138 RepID=UPI003816F369
MLRVGDKAPDFTAESTQGRIHLAELLGQNNVVLIFYPGDDTPVCTKQLCAVQDNYSRFAQEDTVVLGVNPAALAKHQSFSRKFGYGFPLIVDQNEEIRKLYKVGKILGLFAQQRVVYVIDKDGIIRFAQKGNPRPDELLDVIKKGANQC